jgi:hypothetical protein
MSEGRKDDAGKLPWWLLPLQPVEEVLRVLYWAAYEKQPKPYGPNNWQGVPDARRRYYDAAMRHLTDYWKRHTAGRTDMADHESGLHILAHAGCCILFVLWFELLGKPDTQSKTELVLKSQQEPATEVYMCPNCSIPLKPMGFQKDLYRCAQCGQSARVEQPEFHGD